jgi:hypothetical protein
MLVVSTLWAAQAATPIPASDADAVVDGAGADRFGRRIRSGDLNDDGEPDLVIGAPHPSANRVYVFFGPIDLASAPSLDAGQADVVVEGLIGAEAGWALAVGDVVGGAEDDLVVTSRTALGGAGQIHVFEGPLGGSPILDTGAPDLQIDGVGVDAYAGWSVATGDWDGDGKDEIAVGACGAAVGNGAAYLVDADVATSPLSLTDATATFTGIGLTGCSMANLGDFDGDGIEDLGVGSFGAAVTTQLSYGGTLSIVYGRTQFDPQYSLLGVDEEDIANLNGEFHGSNFAFDIAAAGDLNNDRYVDLVVGAPSQLCAGCTIRDRTGRMYVVLGGPSSGPNKDRYLVGNSRIDAIADMIYEAPSRDEQVGRAVASAGYAGSDWGKFTHPVLNYTLVGPTLLAGSGVDQAWVVAYDNRDRLNVAPDVACTYDPETDGFSCRDDRSHIPAARGWRIDLGSAAGVNRVDGDPGSVVGFEVHGPGDLNGDGLNDFAIGATWQLGFDGPAGDGQVLLFKGE